MATTHTFFSYIQRVECSLLILNTVMEPLPEFQLPAYYEFRVLGQLSLQSAPWFEGMDITPDESADPAQTIILGYMMDQAALYGSISRIRDLGLTLISVKRVERREDS